MIKIEKDKRYRLTDKFGKIVDFLCLKIEDNTWGEEEYIGICCTVNLAEIFFHFVEVFYKINFTKEDLKNYKIEPLTEKPNFVKYQNVPELFRNIKDIFFIGKAILAENKDYMLFESKYIERYFCTIFYFRLDNLFTEIIFCDSKFDREVNLPYAYVFQSEFQEDLSIDLFTYQNYQISFSFDSIQKALLEKYFT